MSYEKNTWNKGDVITAEKLNNVESGIEEINVSYEKTTWETGDTITAEKLNNIETGIEEAGSSDFSTATVTIANLDEGPRMYNKCFACYEENELGEGSPTMLGTYIGIEPNSSVTLKVPLYKGYAYWVNPFDSAGAVAVVTGDIINNNGNFTITGDGTITLGGAGD